MGGSPEFIPAVHERDSLSNRGEIECPIERGIPPSDYKHATSAEIFNPPDGVKDTLTFIGFNTGYGRLFGLKGASARSDNHRFGLKFGSPIGYDAKQWLRRGPKRFNLSDHFTKMKLSPERFDLRPEIIDEALDRKSVV